MPRLRVEPSTTNAEILEAIQNAITSGHTLEAKLAKHRFMSDKREEADAACRAMNDELERLTNILRSRRSRIPAQPHIHPAQPGPTTNAMAGD